MSELDDRGVLHVEDEDADARLVAEIVEAERLGLVVERATCLDEASARLRERTYDLILLDLGLPDGDGIENIRSVRTVAPETPIVALSGTFDHQLALDGVTAGAQDFVAKSEVHLPGHLRRTLHYALERHEMTRRLEERARELAEGLFESEVRSQQILETIRDGLIVADPTGRILYANPAATDLVRGETLPANLVERLDLAVRSGTIGQVRLETGHGSRQLDVRVSSTTWEGGAAYLLALRDVTELVEAGEALRQRTLVLQSILDAMSDGVVVTDPEGRFLVFNPEAERILGPSGQAVRPDEWPGRFGLLAPGGEQPFPAGDLPIVRALAGQSTGPLGAVVDLPDRSRRHVLMTGRALRHEVEGEVFGGVVTLTDVTAYRAAQEALRESREQLLQSQKMEAVGLLAGGVAHDFNNLLTAITGYAQMAIADLPADHPIQPDLAEIKGAADRAAGLTRQLLAFGRRQRFEVVVVDLAEVVIGMDKLLRRLIGEDVEIEVDCAGDLAPVAVDVGQIEQVLLNLAVNARDAMPGGGRLSIRVAARAGPAPGVALEVSDTGHGMDEATRRRIFEPFFTTKPQGKGTGLGLSTAFGIVEQHGGRVEVESEVGAGTTFRILLPAAVAPAAARDGAVEVDRRRSSPSTILLVEDEDALRALAARVLRRAGHEVLEAGGGAEALRIFERLGGAVDLLVTDVVMPGLSGPGLGRRLREGRPELPILFVSGYSDEAREEDPGGGIEDVRLLQKPFDPGVLVDAVARLLEDRGIP